MLDRVSGNPGRIKLTDDITGEARYYHIEMADEPTTEGTALNKANLLTDATANLLASFLGASSSPSTVNEAFAAIANKGYVIATGSYTGTISESWPNNMSNSAMLFTIEFPIKPDIVFVISEDELHTADPDDSSSVVESYYFINQPLVYGCTSACSLMFDAYYLPSAWPNTSSDFGEITSSPVLLTHSCTWTENSVSILGEYKHSYHQTGGNPNIKRKYHGYGHTGTTYKWLAIGKNT